MTIRDELAAWDALDALRVDALRVGDCRTCWRCETSSEEGWCRAFDDSARSTAPIERWQGQLGQGPSRHRGVRRSGRPWPDGPWPSEPCPSWVPRDPIDGFSTRLGTIANTVDRGLTRAFRVAAAAVAGVGTAAAVTGAEFEAQMTRVAVISGATREEFAALTEEARKIGRETLFTATDAAKGMEALAQAGLNPQQVMAAVSDTLALAGAKPMGPTRGGP